MALATRTTSRMWGKFMKSFSARKMAYLGVLTAMALVTFAIENLLPPLFLPSAKMGLSNIFGLFTLLVFGWWEALVLVILRTVLGCLITGSLSTLMYSLPAGIIAMAVSILLVKTFFPRVSVVSVSVVAAVIHNLVQNAIFIMVSGTKQMIFYTPYLAIIGVLSGVIVGTAVYLIIRYAPNSLLRAGQE
ncbi:MAG TPA: Gx transporter family protein [Eubacteriales bacterium]|nr:Gx transporter family protein [Eubacteriales bacterium]